MPKIRVEKVDKAARVPKEVRDKLKELRLTRRVSFMKKERVLCPMVNEVVTPAICLACEYFRRRVKGVIDCGWSSAANSK